MGIDDKAANLNTVRTKAIAIFDSKIIADEWLNKENSHLDGKSPFSVIMNDNDGFEKVMSLLKSIKTKDKF